MNTELLEQRQHYAIESAACYLEGMIEGLKLPEGSVTVEDIPEETWKKLLPLVSVAGGQPIITNSDNFMDIMIAGLGDRLQPKPLTTWDKVKLYWSKYLAFRQNVHEKAMAFWRHPIVKGILWLCGIMIVITILSVWLGSSRRDD